MLDSAMPIDPVGGFMQWHSLSGAVSAKPELMNHLGPEITVQIAFWGHLSGILERVL